MRQLVIFVCFFCLFTQKIHAQNIDGEKSASQDQSEKKRINEVIFNYMNATSIQERAKYVVDSKKTEDRMLKFYDEYVPTRYNLENFVSYLFLGNDKYKAYFETENISGGKSMEYLYLTKENSQFYIDWLKNTGYNDVNLTQFNENNKLAEIIMRVEIGYDQRYSDNKYYKFNVNTNFDAKPVLQEKNSQIGENLYNILSGGKSKKFTVKLKKINKINDGFEDYTFKITEIIKNDW